MTAISTASSGTHGAPHPGHAHKTEPHHHDHAGPCSHGEAAQVPTPGHFLADNPCDAPAFSEICACCQGALDVDELLGLKAAAPHEGMAQAHSHTRFSLQWPKTPAARTMAGATVWATVPGLYFGVQNYRAASSNVAVLRETLARLTAGGAPTPTPDQTPVQRQEALNRKAYADTLGHSISMQRFIAAFAGAVPLMGAALMLGSVVVPPLSLGGSAVLGVYCGSHICRYMGWERPRTTRLHAALTNAPRPDNDAAALGLEVAQKQMAQRKTLYPRVAAAFAVYGVGAGMLAASALLHASALIVPGACVLTAGLVAVVYLNNGPIKAAFGKNGDRAINRRALGDQQAILEEVGRTETQLHGLDRLRAAVQRAPTHPNTRLLAYAYRAREAAALGLSYGLTFGIFGLGREAARDARERHALGRIVDLSALVAPYEAQLGPAQPKSPVEAARMLLHAHKDAVAHRQAALLDHLHARVLNEGLAAAAHA